MGSQYKAKATVKISVCHKAVDGAISHENRRFALYKASMACATAQQRILTDTVDLISINTTHMKF